LLQRASSYSVPPYHRLYRQKFTLDTKKEENWPEKADNLLATLPMTLERSELNHDQFTNSHLPSYQMCATRHESPPAG
jgi:hypothetical protein